MALKDWLGGARALVELKKIRQAQERQATALEELLLFFSNKDHSAKGSVSFRTYYKDRSKEEGQVMELDDAHFSRMEQLEKLREQYGGARMDEDLEEWPIPGEKE